LFFNIIAFLSFALTSKQKEQRLKGKRKEGAGVVIKEVKNIAVWFSLRLADRKSAKFQKNVLKRGSVPESSTKKGSSYPVGPIVLGFFVFVVIGSAVLQIFRTATSGGMA
jgi:hypothetical protein